MTYLYFHDQTHKFSLKFLKNLAGRVRTEKRKKSFVNRSIITQEPAEKEYTGGTH